MSQKKRLRDLFLNNPNKWIPLPAILDMRISQYGARIMELRRSGMLIDNKWKFVEGQKHSWFMYIPDDDKGQWRFI